MTKQCQQNIIFERLITHFKFIAKTQQMNRTYFGGKVLIYQQKTIHKIYDQALRNYKKLK